MDNLRQRNMIIANACPLCLFAKELVNHFLLNSKVAYSLWNLVLRGFECSWVLPCTIVDFFNTWMFVVGSPKGRIFWSLSFLAIIWVIWKEMNQRCFEGKVVTVEEIFSKIKLSVTL